MLGFDLIGVGRRFDPPQRDFPEYRQMSFGPARSPLGLHDETCARVSESSFSSTTASAVQDVNSRRRNSETGGELLKRAETE